MSIHATSTEVYSGKNLYNPTISPTTAYGVTGVGTVNGFTLNGTANANGYRLGFNSATLPAGTYTVTVYYDSGTHSGGNIPFILYKTGTWTSVTSFYAMNFSPGSTPGNRTATFTLSEETEVTLYVYFGNDPTFPTFTDFKGRVQVEAGSTATSFEPYVGGVPSPLISNVAHVSTSKNLLNIQSGSDGEYFGTMSQGGYSMKNLYIGSPSFSGYTNESSWTSDGTYNGMPVVKKADSWGGVFKSVDVIAGKTYTFSAWVKSDQARAVAIYATGGSTGATATISPGSNMFTSSTNWERVSFTFTCDTSGTVGLRIENRDSSTTNYTYISGYQLEVGQEATSYEKYIGNGIYSGKNILNASSSFTVTNSTVYRSIPISIPSGATVCVQCDSITTNSTTGCSVRFQDSNFTGVGTVILYPGTTLSQSVTLTGNAAYCYVYSSNNYVNSQSATTTYTNLMVSTGSTAQSYEPYVGGVPSPNPDYPQEIVTGKLASKNLFALSKTNVTSADVSYTYNSDGTFSLSGIATANGDFSIILPTAQSGITSGQTYSLWSDHALGWGDNSVSCYIQGCTEDGTWLSNLAIYQANTSQTIPTITSQYIKFVLVFRANTKFNNYNNVRVQLVKGGTYDANFEPYFAPIELAKIGNYQDSVYKSGSSWYTHKELDKIVLDGTENWNGDWQNSGTPGYWQVYIKAVDFTSNYQVSGVDNTRCDYFIPSGTNSVWNFRGYGFALNPSATYTLQFKMPDTFIDNVADFKTWLSSNNTTAYYALATQTDTAITDPTTISWLNKYDTDSLPHYKYVNTRRTTYVGASGLTSAIDLYDGSYASALPTYTDANDHHLTTANGGTYTVSLQNISAQIISGTVAFSVFTNQRKIDFSWNGSATSTSVSVSLQADEYIKSIYTYIPQSADAGITLSQQLESGSLTDFEPYYNIVKIYAGDDLVFEDTSLTD